MAEFPNASPQGPEEDVDATERPAAADSASAGDPTSEGATPAAPAEPEKAPDEKPAKAAKSVKAKAPAKKAAKAAKKPAAKAKKAGKEAKAAKAAKEPKASAPAKEGKSESSEKPAKAETKAAAEPKKEAAAAKPAAAKATDRPRSSVVDYPIPPPPVRPPFVPPKNDKFAPATGAEKGGSHSPAFVEKQRQRLLDLRDELVDAMSGMTRDTIRNAPEGSEASGSGMHQGDAGSDAYDRDFALSVLAKEQDALYEIEQALRRIKSGTYGVCEMSSRKIPQARLEAIPFARLTVECQAQWEKEYGNRRFRPSHEVGFSGGSPLDEEDSDAVLLDEDDD